MCLNSVILACSFTAAVVPYCHARSLKHCRYFVIRNTLPQYTYQWRNAPKRLICRCLSIAGIAKASRSSNVFCTWPTCFTNNDWPLQVTSLAFAGLAVVERYVCYRLFIRCWVLQRILCRPTNHPSNPWWHRHQVLHGVHCCWEISTFVVCNSENVLHGVRFSSWSSHTY